MDAFFGVTLEAPLEDTMDKDFGSAMEFDGPLMTEKELQDNNDLIDDLLLSLNASEDSQPNSPFCDVLSIPSPIPMGQNSPTYSCDLPQQADDFMDEFFKPRTEFIKSQPNDTKTEPKIDFIMEEIPQARSPHIALAYDKIQQLGKQRQVQQVIIVNDAGEQTFISIGEQPLEKLLAEPDIKTDRSESPIYEPPTHAIKKTKKEQNKKASQKYRQKKREKEENTQAVLEQLKKDKVTKEKEVSKIQGKNEYLLESIERKFAHLL